jgi:3',5'-cyclic AMP phosphodiesterase CpdA
VLTILHVSDLHFGPYFRQEVAEALLCCAPELHPDLVVASGDFTQRAKPTQFAEARAFLDQLPKVPLVVVPGNHDVPLYRVFERVLSPYGHYRQHISAELDTVLQIDRAVVVALNTTSPLTAITEGRIRPWQLELCEQAFRSAPVGAVRILVAHHHFAHAPDYVRDWPIRGARKALRRLAEMGVELILGGHLHRGYVANSLDVYADENSRPGIAIVQAGTCTSARGRGRERKSNSFNLIHVQEQTIRITRYLYGLERRTFTPIVWHEFLRINSPDR